LSFHRLLWRTPLLLTCRAAEIGEFHLARTRTLAQRCKPIRL
jgi:hypothetical protein